MVKKIKIIDGNFHGDPSMSLGCKPTNMKWLFIKNLNEIKPNDVVVITDLHLSKVDLIKCRKKIALILEPPAYNPQCYQFIKKNFNKFDKILTHNRELLELDSRFTYFPNGMCWIKKGDWRIYHQKNKLLSIIASGKNLLEGHKLRHQIVKMFVNKEVNKGCHLFGRAYNPLDNKLIGMKDFFFQIVVENSRVNDYFTEKIIDCFVTGVVPIYWGTENIGKYFNKNGIITFNTIDELKNILKDLTIHDYHTRMDAIKENFIKAQEYAIPEDWIMKNLDVL